MKIFKTEDFPIKMTVENVDILARMLDAFPPLEEWRNVSELISDEEMIMIWNRASEIQNESEKIRWESLTIQEQELEKKQIEESMNDTKTFRGNILEQERHSADLARREIEK